ncbi:non-specific lipid transfer protein GPI-anchored 7-like [Curcuma longa]|uniref:non-specific lipid transfer protein GPI-anchored 7-like n=1 Tax=Curcuma longa TaxID=136217 RepID=UPI003D9EA5F3
MMEKAAVTLLLLAAAAVTAAGMKEQQCAENLLPCSQYLNATSKPPEPCCRVLRSEVEDELPCLCAILNNSAILDAFNMSSARAFQFASDCGVTNTSVCASSGPTPPRAPLPLTPPASGGTTYFRNTIGLPVSMSLLLCWSIGVV